MVPVVAPHPASRVWPGAEPEVTRSVVTYTFATVSPRRSALLGVLGCASLVVGCGSGDDTAAERGTQTIIELPDSQPGDVIALRSGDAESRVVEWIDRRAGTIRSVDLAVDDLTASDIVTLASIEVGTDGEQRGLLGHAVIDGVRYAAWTDPDTEHLLVGALGDGQSESDGESVPAGVDRIVWDAGGTAGGAVGGHLEATTDGKLVLGIGQLTDWAKDHGSGAMLLVDPAGPADQEPVVLSDGYTNPFAFAVIDDQLWVADNAVGDDIERIGTIDLGAGSKRVDRSDLDVTDTAPRAPSAVTALPDGEIAICGFLDAQLRRWSSDPAGYGDPLGPCLTGATDLADGTIVTATIDGLVAFTP